MRLALIDRSIIAAYFAAVLVTGFILRRRVRNSADFLLSGRSLPLWVTGIAFMAADLGIARSQGVRRGPGPFVWREVAYSRGSIRAVGRKGTAVLEHVRHSAGEPYRIALSADAYEIAAGGRDAAYLKARVFDRDGRLVVTPSDSIRFEVSGVGELVGPRSQRLLVGVATLASVRSTTAEGHIKVTVRYGRLTPATLTIRTTQRRSSVDYEWLSRRSHE